MEFRREHDHRQLEIRAHLQAQSGRPGHDDHEIVRMEVIIPAVKPDMHIALLAQYAHIGRQSNRIFQRIDFEIAFFVVRTIDIVRYQHQIPQGIYMGRGLDIEERNQFRLQCIIAFSCFRHLLQN